MSKLPAKAQERIQAHLDEVAKHLDRGGRTAAEMRSILEDLHAQIIEMLAASSENPNEQDVELVLSRLDSAEMYGDGEAVPETTLAEPASKPYIGTTVPAVILGIIFPLGTFTIEMITAACAQQFFDPMPTIWHQLLVASVPAINALLWTMILKRSPRFPRVLGFLSGLAIGVSTFYTVVFLPALPIAIIATILLIGFLPLTPVLSLIGSTQFRELYGRSLGAQAKLTGLWPGFFTAMFLFLILMLPSAITDHGLRLAASPDPNERERGIELLRDFGSERHVLRTAYMSFTPGSNPISFLLGTENTNREAARDAYYRFTGRAFNSMEPPFRRGRDSQELGWDRLELNPDLRDESVTWQDQRLALEASRIDGVFDAEAGTNYQEWTMVFANAAAWEREAKCEVLLPRGGVVSRLTLWVNGEEREAAFASTGQVKQAYENIVARRKDPVLVTSKGNDRVTVQCYPVPASGKMKIRIGITSPLELLSVDKVTAGMPMFLERNFSIPQQTKHSLWLEGKSAGIEGRVASLPAQKVNDNWRLMGELTNKELEERPSFVLLRDANKREVIEPDPRDSTSMIKETIVEKQVEKPRRVILVADASAAAADSIRGISDAVASVASDIELGLVVASESAKNVIQPGARTQPEIAKALQQMKGVGGQDNLPALEKAWFDSTGTSETAIVWIHGPQPVELKSPESFLQTIERSPTGPVIYDMQVAPGRNVVRNEISRRCDVRQVNRSASPQADLKHLFAEWNSGDVQPVYVREKVARDSVTSTTQNTSSTAGGHIARLWAASEVQKLVRSARSAATSDSISLATRYQLVTQVTGAVVLETKQQFADAGLETVSPTTVPTIPEPETWALICVAGVLLIFVLRRKVVRTC